MADVLPGYTYDRTSSRYRDATTGRYVARERITQLLDTQVVSATQRMGALSDAYQAGKIAPGVWAEQMRTEARRLHLQQAALARGGWDRLTQSDYGRVGQALRQLCPKIVGTAQDVQVGAVTPAQLQARITAYAGSARSLYYQIERLNTQSSEGMTIIERRILDPEAESCEDCIEYASQGWQPVGVLPVPGQDCECEHHCRCGLKQREIRADQLDEWIGTLRESERAMPNDNEHVIVFEEAGSEFVPLIEKSMRRDGTIPLKLIQPGWGASGYYPAEVLERDGPQMFKAGMQMFWDHQTATEEAERPEGSLSNLAAVLVSDARWDTQGAAGPGLYADAKPFGDYKQAIEELAPHIGVSIRGGGRAQFGEADGRKGRIIQAITETKSVDFVTKPGAGGQIIQLFESARPGNVKVSDQEEDMSEELKTQLQEAQTRMAQIEQENARLREAMLLNQARDYVAGQLATSTLPDITKRRLAESLAGNPPVGQDGKLDTGAYAARIQEAIKQETEYLQQVAGYGSGRIQGMGGTGQPANSQFDEAATQKRLAESFALLGLNEREVEHAVGGRVW